MKARIIATEEIVDVTCIVEKYVVTHDPRTVIFEKDELDFDIEDNSDYWTRLEHQYAGMAMQGILSNPEYLSSLMHTKHNDYGAHEVVPDVAVRLSHALVEKLKEKEERK